MSTLHSAIFVLHILFGSMALVLFWLPLATKKGSLDHVKFGRYYGNVMYVVAGSGATMALLVIYAPLTIKHQLALTSTNPEALALNLRVFWSFLLYLSLITFTSIRHGALVIRNKRQHSHMRSWAHLGTIALLFAGGLGVMTLGVLYENILHLVFAMLGIVMALQMARFCLAKTVSANAWLLEHLGAFIGSGIGAYSAFIAFGGRQIFSELGELQTIFWIAPGVIGGIGISRMSGKYRGGLAGVQKVTS
jgi:hypothetical protein